MKPKHILAALIAALLLALGGAQANRWLPGYAYTVIQETNMERGARGLGALRADPELMRAAQVRAEEISRKFSHTRPDGSRGISVSPSAVAENIARGQKQPDKVMAAWLTSAGHRANILRPGYGSIGVACVQVNGIYHWVQLFGR